MFEENYMAPGFSRIQATRLKDEIHNIDSAILHLTDTRKFHYNILNLLRMTSNPDSKSIEKVVDTVNGLKLKKEQLNRDKQLLMDEWKYLSTSADKYETEIVAAEAVAYEMYGTPAPKEPKKENTGRAGGQIFRYFGRRFARVR